MWLGYPYTHSKFMEECATWNKCQKSAESRIGMECSTIRLRDINVEERRLRKLKTIEMWICRRMEKVCWTKMKTNEEVLNIVEEDRKLIINQSINQSYSLTSVLPCLHELDGLTYNTPSTYRPQPAARDAHSTSPPLFMHSTMMGRSTAHIG